MTRRTDMADDRLARLEHLLAVYGADSDRWPAAERAVVSDLLAAEPAARRMLAAATALDAALDRAETRPPLAATERARDRLFARLDAEAAPVTASTGRTAKTGEVVPFARPAAPRVPQPAGRGFWREAGVLAAALLIGVFTGTQGLIDGSGLGLSGRPAEVTATEDVSALALGSEDEVLTEEELL